MDINKIRGYLNISQKAGYIIWGGDNLKDYTKKLYLVLYNPNCQKSTIKIVEKIKQKDILVVPLENLGILLKRENCKIIGIKNKKMSDIIYSLSLE